MQRAFSRRASRRRGLTLVVVMAVVATVVIVAIAFLQSQSSGQRVAQNSQSADLAMQAAQAGVAAALDAMQTPGWSGVGAQISAEVVHDARGVSSYTVSFIKIDPGEDATLAEVVHAAFQVHIHSVGKWTASGSERPVERIVEATVALRPRLPNRTSQPGDDFPLAEDRGTEVSGFEQARNYAIFAPDESNSFESSPQTRVSGDIWVGGELSLYDDLDWDRSETRAALLTGLGTDRENERPDAALFHPLGGSITLYGTPDSSLLDDLTIRLQTPPPLSSPRVPLPAFDPEDFLNYRLFDGGFEYHAVQLGSSLTSDRNGDLHPTASNPLGIFYCNGSLSVEDDVVVRGTLVASSGVTFSGRGIAITPFDWRDGSGGGLVADRERWPILPAVVADGDVTFRSNCQVFIEGSVVTSHDAEFETPDYDEEAALLNCPPMNAIATPLGNGLSRVNVTGLLELLAGLTVDTRHAVQFQSGGVWSEWYPVAESASLLGGTFVVRGTVDLPSSTACRFQPRRVHHTDILGPVIARRVRFRSPPAWSSVRSSEWRSKYDSWQSKRNGILGLLLARPNLTFTQSLQEEPGGLPFEPTVRISRPQNVNYACEPPLFSADDSSRLAGGGYRWEVTSWAEVSSWTEVSP